MGTEEKLTLPDGSKITFRSIQPNDTSALQRFHSRLSERSIYLRFFGSLQELPEEKAQYFSHVDGVDHFALVALDPDDEDEIIAVVRYDRESGEERAEYAALVEDRWQDHGVGIGLTRRLINEALDNGVKCFYALTKGENTRMLELLRHLDLPESEHRQDSHKQVEIKLPSEKF